MKNLSMLLIFLFLISCGEKDTIAETAFDDLCIVTGIQFFDFNGVPAGKVGNPNTTQGNGELSLFPIPSDGTVFISSTSSENKNVWIVPADKNIEFSDIDYTTNQISHSISDIDAKQVEQFGVTGSSIQINLDGLDKGYYRVFVEHANGNINWENIYLDPNLTTNEITDFLNSEW